MQILEYRMSKKLRWKLEGICAMCINHASAEAAAEIEYILGYRVDGGTSAPEIDTSPTLELDGKVDIY